MNAALQIINERFSKDTLLSLATLDGKQPKVRIVDAYYEDGAFYIVTYLLSNKMKQIIHNKGIDAIKETPIVINLARFLYNNNPTAQEIKIIGSL